MKARSQRSATSGSTSPVQQASDALAAYCPDLDQWPRSWRYEERDVPPGEKIVEYFTPFLRHLLNSNLSRTTLRRHRDNLWALGGEIISRLHETPRLRKQAMADVVFAALSDDGGPFLSHHQSEQEQRSFDSTCRKFWRFLKDASDKPLARPASKNYG
jgi:hypothetical protein